MPAGGALGEYEVRVVRRRDEGVAVVEYGLLLALLAAVVSTSAAAVGPSVTGLYGQVCSALAQSAACGSGAWPGSGTSNEADSGGGQGTDTGTGTGPENGTGPGNDTATGPGNGKGNGVGWGGGNGTSTSGKGGTQVSSGSGTAKKPDSGQAGGTN